MRKHLRTTFNQKISFEFAGLDVKAFALTLSEGGVYLRTSKPLPVGSQVKVKIPVQSGEWLVVNGTVVYTMGLLTGRFLIPPGMAIQFDTSSDHDSKQLSQEVCRLLIGDIVEEQEESIFKCTRGQ
jgi:Tfp pilus assembly protein PilZ